MKPLLIILLLTICNFSSKNLKANTYNKEYSISWNYTTGYHSDGTSTPIRYTSNNYENIQIQYAGSWYKTYVNWDNGRKYVKNPSNKRYYF